MGSGCTRPKQITPPKIVPDRLECPLEKWKTPGVCSVISRVCCVKDSTNLPDQMSQQCTQCDEFYRQRQDTPDVCDCSTEYVTTEDLQRRIQAKFLGGLSCGSRDQTFASGNAPVNHNKQGHSSQVERECPICGETFGQKRHLKEHLNVHSDVANKKCTICNKTFKFKRSLRRHLPACSGLVTTKRRKFYPCSYCDKVFKTARYMKQHMQLHGTGTKPCPRCGRKFMFESNYSRHISNCSQ